MRASRLVALLVLLQQRGRATAGALADELEVSVRTVYRDVAALQAAGVPLWTEPGPGGGLRLVDGWRTRLDGMTADEAGALFLAGAPGAVGELGLGTVLAAARTKVLATLPPELRARAARVRERFLLDAPSWFHHDEPLPHLATVADAVWSATRLDVHYRRGPNDLVRRLEPLGLVLKAGVWYVVAASAGDVRTYRVGRITAAAACGERFERPEGFDLAAWWSTASADFDRSLLRDRVRLRCSPAALRLLPHLVGVVAGREAVADAGPPDAEGWREVELAVESEAVARTQLIGLGGGVEVLDPPALRAALAAEGRAMAERNRDVGPHPTTRDPRPRADDSGREGRGPLSVARRSRPMPDPTSPA